MNKGTWKYQCMNMNSWPAFLPSIVFLFCHQWKKSNSLLFGFLLDWFCLLGVTFAERYHLIFYSKLLLQLILSKLLVSICKVTVVSAELFVSFLQLLVGCLQMWGEIALASHEHSSSTGSWTLAACECSRHRFFQNTHVSARYEAFPHLNSLNSSTGKQALRKAKRFEGVTKL